MATISIDGTDLTIDVQGMDKFWSLKSRLTIPMAHVRGATADPSIASEAQGLAGTWHACSRRHCRWDLSSRWQESLLGRSQQG